MLLEGKGILHSPTTKYLIEHGANPALSSELGATTLYHVAGIGEIFYVISIQYYLSITITVSSLKSLLMD